MTPEIQHHFGAGVYAKETRIPANHLLGKHKHTFDHLSILASGTIELWVDGEVSVLTGPACLVVKANKAHRVRAVTDVVWYCVHATDWTDVDTIDEVLIERA